jgi:DNA-binding MarR family transcriptional regulator
MRYNAVDFQSLDFVSHRTGVRLLDLARFLGVAVSTAQSAVTRMVRGGLMARDRSAEDGRAIRLSLTPKGRAVVLAIRRQDRSNCELMLSALPARDRRRFVDALASIAAHVNGPTGQ